jgi:hypothetical protein
MGGDEKKMMKSECKPTDPASVIGNNYRDNLSRITIASDNVSSKPCWVYHQLSTYLR